MPIETERSLLQRAVDKAGQAKKAADLIGMSHAHFSRVFNGKTASHLGVENCFRLAAYLGEPPQIALRAARKDHVADAIDALVTQQAAMRTAPADPIVSELAELLARPNADRAGAQMLIDFLKKRADTAATPEMPARRHGRHR